MDSSLQAVLAAAGSFLVVVILFTVIVIVCKAFSKRQPSSDQLGPPVRTRAIRPRKVPNNIKKNVSDLTSIAIGESATFDPALSKVSMEELLQATANFSPELIVGDGSFGLVYRAKLSTGVMVAVKKLAADAFQGFREFRAEMETLGKLRHANIVKILGYCATGSERVLVYEYIQKGSLDQWLYDTSCSSESTDDVELSGLRTPLPWTTRVKIIKGIARGLAYMHNLEKPIIHRDIKASNVLLDENFEAHIADFGLARRMEGSHSHVSTQVAGTMGYMPPEYLSGATMATMLGDVYSFGVLMLEIITGRRPHFPFLGEDGKEIRLIEWVSSMVAKKQYVEMVDANILRSDLNQTEVTEVITIARMCATDNSRTRPTMKEVVQVLDGIRS